VSSSSRGDSLHFQISLISAHLRPIEISSIINREGTDEDAGLVQRALKSIFDKIASPASDAAALGGGGGESARTTTKASFFEIYNERVYDLLSPNESIATDADDKGLSVREDSAKGVYVEGLYEWEVANTSEAMDALRCGTANRSVAATNMNRVSSRSHAVFVLTVRTEVVSENGVSKVRHSKFTLVDLAGSERQKTTATDGDRLKEASMINSSLLVLGKVINSLVDRERGKPKHVQFRDSKLTFLLRDSFGGNSKTCLVATVSPSVTSLSETISTLSFAQRAKMITNTAVLNENTCGSVTALQAEIARLRSELELASNGLPQPAANGGDRPMADQGLPPSESADGKKLASDITVNALRSQNSKLSKKVEVLEEVSDRRELQVNLLKRKLQQETLIRKCKERRITYLSSKGKMDGGEEIAVLREEVAALREQLESTPPESVEWMLKYKETKAKVEELEASATDTFESDQKFELEASLISLLNERDTLRQKVQKMSDERNIEIDNIIKDVITLENSNVIMQSRLEEKEIVINANLEKIHTDEAQIEALQTCLESTQLELTTEKHKTVELQEIVDRIKVEVENANAALLEHQEKMTVAKEELAKMAECHNESTTELNAKLGVLQDDVVRAMNDNESLMSKLKLATDDLLCTKNQLENLEQVKNDALRQLEHNKEKSDSDLESFKLQEETLRAEISKVEATVESLLAEKSQAAANLKDVATNNTLLLGEVEALKSERDALQRRVASLDKLHDRVAMLEDEVTFFTILQSNEAEYEADCDRDIRLQDHLLDAQNATHIDELGLRDQSIDRLSREKSSLQMELARVSRQLLQVAEASEEKISLLENDASVLQDKNMSLEADIKMKEETVESLRSNVVQIAQRLELVTDEVEAVNTERDESERTLNAKIADLQIYLDAASGDKDLLIEQLDEASSVLKAKESQLDILAQERDQGLKQLEVQRQEYNADTDSLKLQLETVRGEIQNAGEANVCLLAEKAEAAENLAMAKEANACLLAEKAEAAENLVKAEEANLRLLTEKAETAANLAKAEEANTCLLTEKAEAAENLVKAEEAIMRLRAEKAEAAEKLAKAEEAIMCLLAEKAEAAEKLAKAEEANTCFLAERAEAAENLSKAEESNMRLLTENAEVSENLDKAAIHSTYLSEEVDALKSEKRDCQEMIASLHKLRDDVDTLEDEVEYSSILNLQVDSERRFAEADLYRTGRLLNLHDNDLVDRDEIIVILSAEKAMLQADVTNFSNQLAANDVELDRMKNNQSVVECERDILKSREETLKAEIEALTEEKQYEEALKVTIDALEKENSTLREQSNVKPPSSSSSSDITSPWEPTPIKSVNETFAADDTFDESMFLPNVDGEADTPQIGDSNTPSKTPFKEMRTLFSPRSREVSAKKAQTPAKRLTRAMRNKMRTPLGKSAVQNTPLSTHLSRRKSSRASSNKSEVAMGRKL